MEINFKADNLKSSEKIHYRAVFSNNNKKTTTKPPNS